MAWEKTMRMLAPPGAKECDAGGGAFRPEWKEGPVRTRKKAPVSRARSFGVIRER
jgi:hypothetical protein